MKELKAKLSGDFEDVIIGLLQTPTKYDVLQLHKAVNGIGTKEKVLIEVLCSQTNDQIEALRNQYQTDYGKSLEHDITHDTSGTLKRLLVSLIQGNRDQSSDADQLRANQDARKLLADGEKKLGTDEATFISIIASQNLRQLDRVFEEYEKISGHSITKAIENEFSGNSRVTFLAIVQCVQNKPKYFAMQLYEAMKGLGTRDSDLIRIIISRSEIDLERIKGEFEQLYKKSLADYIKSECSGAYRDALIEIVRGN